MHRPFIKENLSENRKRHVGGQRMLQIQNVSKLYKGKIALHPISFSVEKGEIVGILGSNGAGKTTLMNIITGYISMSSGDVWIDGQHILEEPDEVKKKIGYLPDTPPLYDEMTVKEYLSFVAKLKEIENKKSAITKTMEKLNINHVQHRLIKNLSKGYRQRVGIAQAILGNPPVIILDEPTSGLDPEEIIRIRQVIRELGKNSLVLISSHVLSEIHSICDSIVVLHEGEMLTDGAVPLYGMIQENVKHELYIGVKDKNMVVPNLIKNIDGVLSVELMKSSDDHYVEYIVIFQQGIDIREQVFWQLANEQIPILHMTMKEKTLEDYFLSLIQKRKGA